MSLEPLFSALAGRRVFVACRLEPKPGGGTNKIPFSPATGYPINAQDPANWLTADEAQAAGAAVGLVIYEGCGYFCIDLDKCRTDTGWSQFAVDTCAKFPGAAVEASASLGGLHIWGSCGPIPEHRTRRNGQGLEIYTRARFVLVTGHGMTGSILTVHTDALLKLIADNFPEGLAPRGDDWTDTPNPDWRGGGTDQQIIDTLKHRHSARSAFGGGITFAALFDADSDQLAQYFPADAAGKAYNASAADQALANHLAWATGYDCERTARMMFMSALYREKWEREDYIRRTVMNAVAGKIQPRDTPPAVAPAPVRAQSEVPVPPLQSFPTLAPPEGATAQWPPPPPLAAAAPPPPPADEPIEFKEITGAKNYYPISEQESLFHGAVYVKDQDGVLMRLGGVYSQRQFNAHFGGGDWQMNADGSKPGDPWDSFIYSTIKRFPRVDGLVFNPLLPAGSFVKKDGLEFLNSWVPITVPSREGDVTRFTNHLKTLYPNGNDAEIIVCYMAAIMQHKGTKFAWTILLQGVEGNGKTYLSEVMTYCVGARYTHNAKASQIDSRFNSAFDGKLLIVVEDVHITEAKAAMWETLKPMITNKTLEIEGKGLDKVTRDVCFNFIMNSNHKDAIRKSKNDRRFAPFFAAQQYEADLLRDGLTEQYFIDLYDWSQSGGYEHIAYFLEHYKIPNRLNPAKGSRRAPRTSSTDQAMDVGRGSVEQEVQEAIDEGRKGFREGWISSHAFDHLLDTLGKSKYLPRAKRHEVIEGMGYMLHPGLPDGRPLATLTDGSKPRLYIPRAGGHVSIGLAPHLIGGAYVQAQGLK